MPNLKSTKSSNEFKRTSEMYVPELSELNIGRIYYVVCGGNKEIVFEHQVRPQIKAIHSWSKGETDEQYEEYKEYLVTMVKNKELLVKPIKDETTN